MGTSTTPELPASPLVPGHTRWQRRDMFGFEDPYSVPYQLYDNGRPMGVFVTSEYGGRHDGPNGPIWHLAISAMWRRPTTEEAVLMLEDFGAEAFEEVPTRKSLVRHFVWPPGRGSGWE